MHHFVILLKAHFGFNRILAVRADTEESDGTIRRLYRDGRVVHQVPEKDLVSTTPFPHGKAATNYIEKYREQTRSVGPMRLVEATTVASPNPGKKSSTTTEVGGGLAERMSISVVETPSRKPR